jgi:hypothetical protein
MPKTIIRIFSRRTTRIKHCLKWLALSFHVIWELQQYLRGEMKHGDLTDEQYQSYEKIRTKLFDLIDENKAHLE